MLLQKALAHHAKARPEQVAVSLGTCTINFADLYTRSQALDGFLSTLTRQHRSQVQEVPLVAIHLGNHTALPELLATALAGSCCLMLLDPLLPNARTQDILDRLPPDVLFSSAEDHSFKVKAPVFSVASHESLDPLIAASMAPTSPPNPSDPFMVAFTSGTTSTPKAFARDRASWQRSLARGRRHFTVHEGLSTLAPGPLVHGLSLYAFAETLEAGASFHTMEKFTADGAANIINTQQVRRLVCVPTMLEALSQSAPVLPQLAQVTTAGAKLNPDLLEKTRRFASNAEITEYYGASELGFVTAITHRAGSGTAKSVGTAFPEVALNIRDADAEGNGEIWVKSDLIIEDYLWRDDDTGFRRDGDWSSVGDIGRIEGGNLYLTSRAGGMVTTGGNNVYLDEVSTHLRAHSHIKDAVVLGIEDRYLGTRLVAVVELSENGITQDALIAHCQSGLQKYKTPKAFYSLATWPSTSSGKVATGQLKSWILEEDDRLAPL